MSVRKNDRRQSDIEYENTLTKLKSYITSKIKHCPVRYRNWVSRPFSDIMVSIYEDVMQMTNLYNEGKSQSINRFRACASALSGFNELIKLSYTFINLSCIRDGGINYVNSKQRKFWAGFVNQEIDLIYGVAKKCRADKTMIAEVPVMRICTNYEIRNTIFLDKLSRLQVALYKVAARASKTFTDPSLCLLLKLSREAFYHAVEANSIKEFNTESDYRKRQRHLDNAIDSLYNMNRPVFELWPSGVFNSDEIETISILSNESIKILKAVRESDTKVFNS